MTRHSLVLCAILVVASISANAAPKTDTLIFKNGDRLTGEIKSLARGHLSFNTEATGTIAIEWDKVAHLISSQHIQVETGSGLRYFGSIAKSTDEDSILIVAEDGPESISRERIIKMDPIEGVGFRAWDVDVSLGYNFAKSTGVKQGSFGMNVDYRTLMRIYSLKVSTLTSDSNGQTASQRQNLGFQYTKLWNKRWLTNGNVTLDRNDELGLDLRTSIGAGGGRYLIQSNSMLLSLEGGLQFSRENLTADTENKDSLEGVFTLGWDWFKFEAPELDWSNDLKLIPSLTEGGRVRAEFDSTLKWEIIGDLNWGLTLYSSYDNQPQAETASTSDYGVNTQLTYKF